MRRLTALALLLTLASGALTSCDHGDPTASCGWRMDDGEETATIYFRVTAPPDILPAVEFAMCSLAPARLANENAPSQYFQLGRPSRVTTTAYDPSADHCAEVGNNVVSLTALIDLPPSTPTDEIITTCSGIVEEWAASFDAVEGVPDGELPAAVRSQWKLISDQLPELRVLVDDLNEDTAHRWSMRETWDEERRAADDRMESLMRSRYTNRTLCEAAGYTWAGGACS